MLENKKSLPAKSSIHTNTNKKKKNSWLGKYPGRTLHRLGATIGGIWITSSIINTVLPLPDQVQNQKSSKGLEISE